MERELEIIQQVLRITKEYNDRGLPIPANAIEGHTAEQIEHHIDLLIEAGLIKEKGNRHYADDTLQLIQLTLTNNGHDFIESANNSSKWKKAVSIIADKGIELTAKTLAEFMYILSKQQN
jgi:hypothetical protein